jgi:hypothetical protein
MSIEAIDLFLKFIKLPPEQRIGFPDSNGDPTFWKIKNHHFFSGFDWEKFGTEDFPEF